MSSMISMGDVSQEKAEARVMKSYYQWETLMAAERRNMAQEEIGQQVEQMSGMETALYGKAGVDVTSGSPLLALQETAKRGELAKQREQWSFVEQAMLNRFKIKLKTKAAQMAQTSAIVKTGITVASMAVGGIAGAAAAGAGGGVGGSVAATSGAMSGMTPLMAGVTGSLAAGGYGGDFLTSLFRR